MLSTSSMYWRYFVRFSVIFAAASHLWTTFECCWAYYVPPPPFSRATKLPNEVYEWRGQKIRYQVAEPVKKSRNTASQSKAPTVILVHGLFVNSDHWRKTLKGLSEGGYRTFAIDLLGCGYSSKPPANSVDAKTINGENFRFLDQNTGKETQEKKSNFQRYQSVLRDVTLGTPQGTFTTIRLRSLYNQLIYSSCSCFFRRALPSRKIALCFRTDILRFRCTN
jgi:hypothetical protein